MKMPFGKYKGMEVDDLPINYMQWCCENINGNDALIIEMESQLAMRGGLGKVVKKDGSHSDY